MEMTSTLLAGVVAIIAGIAILLWPFLLNFVVAFALIVGGVWLVYAATAGRRVVRF
ncbi:MAG: DUF3096 domain-containing protein [Chloroflexi bacterium]|nr:DUF3096 domain-containing protein [Chloroflexota bacterium]